MTRINSFKGYVGLTIKELKEINTNSCTNKNLAYTRNFTDNFWLRIYTSGCYYMDPKTNEWSSRGMDILSDTNLTHTHCVSNHLTTFAGGFVVLPNAIDFEHVWANSSFLRNPVIYSTVIALLLIYFLLGIWARYMDYKDSFKCGITLLSNFYTENKDKEIEKKYIYEIIVFTGNRLNAGTKSNALLRI